VYEWEKRGRTPNVRYMPEIIHILGYIPKATAEKVVP
jgi:hypothetical protein